MKRNMFISFVAMLIVVIAASLCFASNPVAVQGLSTDTKPTYVAPGSSFYETDTTYTWIYRQYPDGTKAWVRSTTGSATTFYLATLASNQEATITATAAELNNMHNNTATAAELSVLHSVVAGTASASSAAVLGANKNLDTLALPVSGLKIGSGAGTAVTASAAELNTTTGTPTSITTAATPGSGTNTAQFVFKNAAGAAISRVFSGIAYISDINGAHVGTQTAFAIATNGSLTQLVGGKVIEFTSTSSGLLGLTLTGAGGSYYITFVLPQGVIATSSVITLN